MTYSAVFPPMPTPFDNGEVDPVAISRNVERWMRTGLGGVVALGTNGEAALLDEHESDTVIGAARDAVPRDRMLIAGTGRESTRATIDATRRAASLGADAALVRTPSVFKARMTGEAFTRHYTAVAEASPIPILLYNFPALTGVNLAPETVARLAEHPNIAGMKESSADAAQLSALVDVTKPPFAVLVGAAPAFYAALAAGAVGAILAVACVLPDACVRLLAAFGEGRHHEARELQRRLSPLARLVTTGHGIPGLKAALDLVGYSGGDPRPPLAPVSRDGLEQIRAALATIQELV
jgi:4-hydroxy-2-oxoglutarate aldolase